MGFCFGENKGGRADMVGLACQPQGEGKQPQGQRRQENCSPSTQPSPPLIFTHLSWQQCSRASHIPGKPSRVGALLPVPSSAQPGSRGEPGDDSARSSLTGTSHTANGLTVGERAGSTRSPGLRPVCPARGVPRPTGIMHNDDQLSVGWLWSRLVNLTVYRVNISADSWVTPAQFSIVEAEPSNPRCSRLTATPSL